MPVLNALSALLVWVRMPILSCTSSKDELFVYLEKPLCPQLVLIKDVSRNNFGRNTSSEVFDTLSKSVVIRGYSERRKTRMNIYPGHPPLIAL